VYLPIQQEHILQLCTCNRLKGGGRAPPPPPSAARADFSCTLRSNDKQSSGGVSPFNKWRLRRLETENSFHPQSAIGLLQTK
jgi:hypothetical protein